MALPAAFFSDCKDFKISGGTFNDVRGNLHVKQVHHWERHEGVGNVYPHPRAAERGGFNANANADERRGAPPQRFGLDVGGPPGRGRGAGAERGNYHGGRGSGRRDAPYTMPVRGATRSSISSSSSSDSQDPGPFGLGGNRIDMMGPGRRTRSPIGSMHEDDSMNPLRNPNPNPTQAPNAFNFNHGPSRTHGPGFPSPNARRDPWSSPASTPSRPPVSPHSYRETRNGNGNAYSVEFESDDDDDERLQYSEQGEGEGEYGSDSDADAPGKNNYEGRLGERGAGLGGDGDEEGPGAFK
ncbi:hypothetical protein K438DRAFT_440325 [Mycena galopus ATCC 62051]|nr:hypothetical protein K438DRAFT_440325 [Mycena galopus ATCC 62051]